MLTKTELKELEEKQHQMDLQNAEKEAKTGEFIVHVKEIYGQIKKFKAVYPSPIDGKCPKCHSALKENTIVGEGFMHYKLAECAQGNCNYEYADIYYEDYV